MENNNQPSSIVPVQDSLAVSEEVYNQYQDTAGNWHWTGTKTGEHIIRQRIADRQQESTACKD